jgi:hypothetical protein
VLAIDFVLFERITVMPRHANGNGYSIVQLERMLENHRSRLSTLERKRSKLTRRLNALDSQIVELGGSASGSGGRARNKSNLGDSIALVLKKASGPMRVTDIARSVRKSGYRTKSSNFRVIVNQALIRDKRFSKGPSRGAYLLKK